jgi:adenosylcobinamide-GDP ribazoletransferase
VLCARGVPAARGSGLGAAVAGVVPTPVAVLVPAAVAGGALLAAVAAGAAVPWRAGAAVLAGCVAGALFAGRAAHRVGGVTGDLLGAGVEVGTTAALVVLALR